MSLSLTPTISGNTTPERPPNEHTRPPDEDEDQERNIKKIRKGEEEFSRSESQALITRHEDWMVDNKTHQTHQQTRTYANMVTGEALVAEEDHSGSSDDEMESDQQAIPETEPIRNEPTKEKQNAEVKIVDMGTGSSTLSLTTQPRKN
ncbi:hypothetical protein PIB30_053782 [Stylosanthes scabra]|uniref:Uncharacterized protein n=1 Tax=Stylosanthes scabra TaxID=79078 RepID=A0ABU6VL07_9FABA|nr:hypothetical protein [Stylosanthes scabra]